MGVDPQAQLRAGLLELGLALNESQQAALLAYLEQLAKWGRVHNLTAVLKPSDMVSHHLLDSLATLRPLQSMVADRISSPRLLDVGSGAGLPGLMLALAWGDLNVLCVDAVAKKMAFVRQAAVTLGLHNLEARHARVERLSGVFDVVCSRAFASLADFVNGSAHLLAQGGVWMALKGRRPDDEMAQLPASVEVFHVEPLRVPGLDAQRCIVWMRPRGSHDQST